ENLVARKSFLVDIMPDSGKRIGEWRRTMEAGDYDLSLSLIDAGGIQIASNSHSFTVGGAQAASTHSTSSTDQR
ncbi:MAG: hypothetical protein AAF420_12160, partial [Pseudomonadota bacterium]